MSRGQLGRAIGRLCGLVGMRPTGDNTDRQLLDRFTEQGDERAFESLLARHGPAVLGVCRRVLGEGQDADDAFQATFLVLVLKARSIRKKDSVSSWLYAVARRVAIRARADSARRRALHDRAARQRSEAGTEATWDDLRPILDEELAHLPHKYR
ncbi:MAG: sigma-70 family RNA polymerase sigma factor, partial [Gemmataceae bacterium]|nr:sigma-70 family RNA polymerase sigma factor [Gemmataceae bacterium]